MLARKKSSRCINNSYVESADFSFTFIDAEDYATSEKWQKIFLTLLIIAYLTSVIVAQRKSL